MDMPRTIKELIEYLTDKGIEISSDVADATKKKFDGLILETPDKIVGEGFVQVRESDKKEMSDDLIKWKTKARKAEQEKDEFQKIYDSGDDSSSKKIEKLLKDNKKLQTFKTEIMTQRQKQWSEIADKVPDNLKEFFKFKKDDDTELSESDLLHNFSKAEEYKKTGLFDPGVETPAKPSAAKLQKGKVDKKTPLAENVVDRMASGYGDGTPVTGNALAENQE